MFRPHGGEDDDIGPVNDQFEAEDERSVTVYCIFGKHHALEGEQKLPVLYDVKYEDGQIDYAEDSTEACAKMVVSGNRISYFVKAGHGGHFYNPIGMYTSTGRERRIKGRDEWDFQKVNKGAFEMYLRFLSTKANRYLVTAEREVR
tara:strand:+ start:424 stop:861 length:438 start_codon:yes stop_codon:yes gene_type:complete